jgi:formylglycine-generating enzyme required for sulfatase activity
MNQSKPSCCSISRTLANLPHHKEQNHSKPNSSKKGMIYLKGGDFLMGTNDLKAFFRMLKDPSERLKFIRFI